MSLKPIHVAALLACLAVLPPSAAEAQDGPAGTARRLASTLSIAVEEYDRGIAGGHVLSADELREATLLLNEARRVADELPPDVRLDITPRLDRLVRWAGALEEPSAMREVVDSVRSLLAGRLGITLDPLPGRAPSLALGARVYATRCARCHGSDGSGNGPAAAGLAPPPSAFTDRARLAGASPLEFFRKVTAGVAGTAMPAFAGALTPEERWAVVLYASGLRYTDAERAAGRAWMDRSCGACLIVLSDPKTSLFASDASLATLLAGLTGERPLTSAVAFARTAAAVEQLGVDRVLAVRRAALVSNSLVRQVRALAVGGRWSDAAARTLDAYVAFEAVERVVGARSISAVRSVETAFMGLRGAVASRSAEAVDRAAGRTQAAVAAAATAVTEGSSVSLVFGQSLLIILREGIEAILIIGALIAFVVRAGAPQRVREIGAGAAAAVVASCLTAGLFASVIKGTARHQEALEGVTLLLASAVLFSVASWLVAKIETERWLAFVSSRMRGALRSGRALALAGVAFLAVYREGVETVLFYGALFGTTDSAAGHMAMAVGLAVGAGLLAMAYVAMQRYGLRIPLRPFFAVTGVLLTVMSVSFAGQGVAELQAAGWMPATPLNLPALPALGVFPTVQTLAAQILVAGAFLGALTWIFWLGPPPALRRSGS